MKIPDDIRKCVAFLQYQDDGGYHLVGTVFFVTMSSPHRPGHFFHYAVTARHVITKVDEMTLGGDVYLRLNGLDSGILQIPSCVDDWHFHPTNNNVDVAIMPVNLHEAADWLFWPLDCFALEATIKKTEISVGDDVFLTGLFHRHAGAKRNIPIVRAGIISAMPEEPVKTGLGETEAFLIEARSISGLSGSPVLVSPETGCVHPHPPEDPYAVGRWGGMASSYWLLGLMHGHWNANASDVDTVSQDNENAELFNAGIGIVVPAQRILEVIEQPVLQELRKKDDG